MREGLSREFPEAVRGAGWVRARITVSKEPVAWAALSGIGAGFLATVVTQALVGLANEAFQAFNATLPFPLFPAVTITGIAAAAAVAFRAGGPFGLALYFAYLAASIALALPSLMLFCERSEGMLLSPGPDRCTANGFVSSLWPQVIALGLGIGLARAVATRGKGVNSLLRVAGALALAQFAVTRISVASIGQATDASASTLTVAAAFAASAVAAGVVAARLPKGIRIATIVAAIWLLPWLTNQVPYASRLTVPIPPEHVLPIAASIVIVPIAAALLILTAAVASRARFVPRDTA